MHKQTKDRNVPWLLMVANNCVEELHRLRYVVNMQHYHNLLGGVSQWQERRSWPVNFPCRTLDLQLMCDHLCG